VGIELPTAGAEAVQELANHRFSTLSEEFNALIARQMPGN
jgi:hypothetical protein